MKPTTTIALCALVQLLIITGAWLLTRSFRKLYLIVSEQTGLLEPAPGLLSSLFASHGWLLLSLPLLFFVYRIQSMKNDLQIHPVTVLGARLCVGITLMVFAFCAWTTSRMMSAAWDQREMPLKPLNESR